MATTAYLTFAEYRLQSDIPGEFVDELEARAPGYVDAKLLQASALIDARLAKRYAAPFAAPYPVIVQRWLIDLVSMGVWKKRGVHALDAEIQEYKAAEERALAELEEAANAETGLFELPLRASTDQHGIVRGFPRSYSEQSPYVALTQQRDIGKQEDDAGGGSYR